MSNIDILRKRIREQRNQEATSSTADKKTTEQDIQRFFEDSIGSFQPFDHHPLTKRLQSDLPHADYAGLVRRILEANPVQKLALEEFIEIFELQDSSIDAGRILFELSRARQFSRYMPGRKILVAAFPKSASSYLSNRLSVGLGLPFAHLTTTAFSPSNLGANGREQELCELTLCVRCLSGKGFVAQHHMKGTPYLLKLLQQYDVQVILTVRNVFDAIVSADDMLCANPGWASAFSQGSQKIPLNYASLKREDRLRILGNTIGIWYLDFYLSWLRLKAIGSDHLLLSYEEHLSKNTGNKHMLYEILRDHLQLDASKAECLQAALLSENFSHEKARFNQGIAGRGREIPKTVRRYLIEHALFFKDELTEPHRQILFGQTNG